MEGRVLIAVNGSAGDLLPVVPIILRLRELGCDVRCVAPRPLPFLLRAHRIPVWSLGRGASVRRLGGPSVVTTRFDGWESVRRLVDHYAVRGLPADVASVEQVMTGWTPDLVVSSTFASSARIVAHRRRIAQVAVCVWPALLARLRCATRFALSYRTRCADLAGLPAGQAAAALVGDLAWGTGEGTIVLHDPGLLARSELAARHPGSGEGGPAAAVGFPYWDDAPRRRFDVDAVARWLDRTSPPLVVVTLGSYMGARRDGLWVEMADAARSLDVRALLVGPGQAPGARHERLEGCLSVGFVPLSQVMGRVAAAVHHGGVGTTFSALRAGTPAVVVPRAFDQPFNARMVEAVSAGSSARPGRLRRALERVLSDDELARGAGAVGGTLVPCEVATERAAQRIVARLSVGRSATVAEGAR